MEQIFYKIANNRANNKAENEAKAKTSMSFYAVTEYALNLKHSAGKVG
ncbi:MAG: hypothetical protein ACI93R_001524 [Flavobacteriales bacterium]|jgi:hypothetical protein